MTGALLKLHPIHPAIRAVVTRLAARDDIGYACYFAPARASSQGGAEECHGTRGVHLQQEGQGRGGMAADPLASRAKGTAPGEGVGAVGFMVLSAFATASTTSAVTARSSGNVGVAGFSTRSSCAATSTLSRAAQEGSRPRPLYPGPVGVPEPLLTTRFARTSTGKGTLETMERAARVVDASDVVLHSSSAEAPTPREEGAEGDLGGVEEMRR